MRLPAGSIREGVTCEGLQCGPRPPTGNSKQVGWCGSTGAHLDYVNSVGMESVMNGVC